MDTTPYTFEEMDEFLVSRYLKERGVPEEYAEKLEDNEIDGLAFLELTIDDLNKLLPDKLGIVKKIYRLIQAELARRKDDEVQAKPPLPVTPPASNSSSKKNAIDDDALSVASTPSSSAHAGSNVSTPSASAHAGPNVSTSSASARTSSTRNFTIPDAWRPVVMSAIDAPTEAEKRKLLTSSVRSAITRDLMTTMYAFMPKPDKRFCTEVAQKLVEKYSFMRDVGTNVSGYGSWEKRLIERANNAAKPERKRQAEMSDTPVPPPKRGRPKKDALLERYPEYKSSEASSFAVSESQKALDKELEKETPRKDLVLPLVKTTFPYRRPLVVQAASQKVSIQTLIGEHKCLKLPYALEAEIDLILGKRDVVKNAAAEWISKWTPAILACAQGKRGKATQTAIQEAERKYAGEPEEDEKKALFLLTSLLSKRDHNAHTSIYEEFEMADNPEVVAIKDPPLPNPRFAAFKDVNGDITYYLFIEQKVLYNVPASFTKSLILWFSVHYVFHLDYCPKVHDVALFFQEFVFGLPESQKAKGAKNKSCTYLTISSDIHNFTVV